MESITEIMDSLDPSKLVPELSSLGSHLHTLAVLAVLAGPLILLVLGLLYLFLPTKEANRKFGFRTYFGMGSVEAWQFAQKIAGYVFGGLGLVLTIIMGIICLQFGSGDSLSMMSTAFNCLIWQFVLVLLAYIGVSVACSVFFDKDGNRKR